MITSASNQQIKNLIQLQKKSKVRKEQGVFLVEGLKMFQEAPSDWLVKTYVSARFMEKEEHRRALAAVEPVVVSDEIFERISDTCTPQGILSVVKRPSYSLNDLLQKDFRNGFSGGNTLLLLLENIQDPGNLGTMLRTGEGAGVTGVIMSRETVDIYNPKTIRSTMGSIYRIPFLYAEDFGAVLSELKNRGVDIFAAHLRGTGFYDEKDYTGNTAFLIGNEGNGLSDRIAGMASDYIKIPMCGKVESLNAAVAASILLYEASRQRRRSEN
ncbi:MAG: RNA methyltransferase [Candidatus Limivivens sp.]|nr:RNA methyltransferase [Candidatus Limivivens sp.]